jgi:hypothetical protein
MSFVYIVIENSADAPPGGGVFPTTYMTFEEAKASAIGKYQHEIDRQAEEEDSTARNDVDVPESETGLTSLYIEKGIYLYIHKLPVKMSGGNRSFFVKSKTRRRKMKLKKTLG